MILETGFVYNIFISATYRWAVSPTVFILVCYIIVKTTVVC